MGKILKIELKDKCENTYFDTHITMVDYPYICKKTVTDDQFYDSLDMIITYFAQKDMTKVIIDLNERNLGLAPTKEMTMEEIEKELGYKVKLVNKKSKK